MQFIAYNFNLTLIIRQLSFINYHLPTIIYQLSIKKNGLPTTTYQALRQGREKD